MKCSWKKHWGNGGTGITRNTHVNFRRYNGSFYDGDLQYQKIAQSVDAFGDAAIWMEDGFNELHSYHRDLSIFWRFHENLHMNYYKGL